MAIEMRCRCGESVRMSEDSAEEAWTCPSCGEPLPSAAEPDLTPDIPLRGPSEAGCEPFAARETGLPAGERDHGVEQLRRLLREREGDDPADESEEPSAEGTQIPRQILWGVALLLIGILGFVVLLKPGSQEIQQSAPEDLAAPVPQIAPADEKSSVRVVLSAPDIQNAQSPESGAAPLVTVEEPVGAATLAAPPSSPLPEQDAGSSYPPWLTPVPAIPPTAGALPDSTAGADSARAASGQARETPANEMQPEKAVRTAAVTTQQAAPSPAEPGAASAVRPARTKSVKDVTKPAGQTAPAPAVAASKGGSKSRFTLNAGSFKEEKNAQAYKSDLVKKGLDASVRAVGVPEKGTWYRVSIGSFQTREEALSFADSLQRKWRLQTFVAAAP
ncbi:MAG: SPOR domain-containing protein [bacterium]